MGKASSAKKVAKAARAGGQGSGVRQRNLLFPGIITGVVLAGSGLIYYARGEYQDNAVNVSPAVGDHWHAAYGVYICDQLISTVDDAPHARGIHSHGDELVHVHPTSRNSSGEKAQTKVWLEDSPLLDIDSRKIEVGDQTWRPGEDTCEVDGEQVETEIVMAYWDDVFGNADPAIIQTDFTEHRFRRDGEGYVFALLPKGQNNDIPKPTSLSTLSQMSGGAPQSPIDPSEINPDDLPDDMDPEDLEDFLDDGGEGAEPGNTGTTGSEGEPPSEPASSDPADASNGDG